MCDFFFNGFNSYLYLGIVINGCGMGEWFKSGS